MDGLWLREGRQRLLLRLGLRLLHGAVGGDSLRCRLRCLLRFRLRFALRLGLDRLLFALRLRFSLLRVRCLALLRERLCAFFCGWLLRGGESLGLCRSAC